jgi:hypothetical protein
MPLRVNAAGLSRDIPEPVKREVRQRSRFGCVICRSGFYEYEHILPFVQVAAHDPAHICCLCASCHGRVTRGQLSKDAVRARYEQLQALPPAEVEPPAGPLDFHAGDVSLAIGGLFYPSAVQTVLRYYGQDVIRLQPGVDGEPGAISALFTDDAGQPLLELDRNEWIGNPESWDIDVVGPRITVRKKKGHIALALRLDPPGRIVAERLDMRFGAHHVLASEHSYALGTHFEAGDPLWLYTRLAVTGAAPFAAALEFHLPSFLHERDERIKRSGGARMETANGAVRFSAWGGVLVPDAGLCVAPGCTFDEFGTALGRRPLDGMREVVFHRPPETMFPYVGGGVLPAA